MLREYWKTAPWSLQYPGVTCPKIHKGFVPFTLSLFNPGKGVAGLVFTSLQKTEGGKLPGSMGDAAAPTSCHSCPVTQVALGVGSWKGSQSFWCPCHTTQPKSYTSSTGSLPAGFLHVFDFPWEHRRACSWWEGCVALEGTGRKAAEIPTWAGVRPGLFTTIPGKVES